MESLSYYDFDSNWKAFLRAWNDPDVQRAFALDISFWTELGFFKNYKNGDPLWKQTKTTYWIGKCVERAQNKLRKESHIALFKRTMSSFCPGLSSAKHYYKACFGSVVKDCEPRPNTIEWFIIPEGPFIFRNSMLACAKIMFQTEDINVCMIGGRMVTLVKSNIVFDLFGYYFDKYDGIDRYRLSNQS